MGSYADIIKKKSREWQCDDLMTSAAKATGKKIPLSSPLLNYATYGGIPRGAITEFFGNPGAGKSSSAIDACKNAIDVFQAEYDQQCESLRDGVASGDKKKMVELEELQERGPKRVLYIDLEHAFDNDWGSKLGIDFDKLDIMQPPNVVAEDILNMVLDLIDSGEVGMIVIDSIPSLVPRAELEKQLGERTVSALAGLLTVFCRKVVPMLSRYDTTLLFINQTRDNMDNPYVTQTPGGRALKFYSSLRIEFNLGNPVDFLGNELPKSAENPAGYIINAKIAKQRSAPFDRRLGSYYLMCTSGIRADMDYALLAIKKYGIIKKSAGWYTICDPVTGEILSDETGKPVRVNGMAKIFEYLKDNPEYFANLREYIQADIEGRDPTYVGNMLNDDVPNSETDKEVDENGLPIFSA